MSQKKTVLIVDDTKTVIMSEKMMLSGLGYEIEVATNGVEALQKLRDSPPAVVLLDIMMPEMDGIEVCKAMKSDPAMSAIPVIMVTTKGEPEKISQAFQAGCDDYITKPINKLELITKVRNQIA